MICGLDTRRQLEGEGKVGGGGGSFMDCLVVVGPVYTLKHGSGKFGVDLVGLLQEKNNNNNKNN